MRRKITYIAHYGNADIQHGGRMVSGAAVSKIEYIMDVMLGMGFEIELLSVADCAVDYVLPSQVVQLCDGCSVKLKKAYPKRSLKGRLLSSVSTARFLSMNLKKLGPEDVVFCYHAVDYIERIIELKKRFRFKLILEIEEVYSDVVHDAKLRAREEAVFEIADGFVFSADSLRKSNKLLIRKPYAVCSGIYRMAPKVAEKLSDGLIHVVYAGTLDPRKGGAAAAAAAGALLDDRYALHILGGGNEVQVAAIESAVANAVSAGSGCKVSYDGFKSGQEFDEFIQSCHIGLSPQDPDADFNATSFPSKVFMYLSNGLKVVSVDLPVFTSDIRQMLSIIPDNTAESIARGVKSVGDIGSIDGCSVANGLNALDKAFTSDLEDLIEAAG